MEDLNHKPKEVIKKRIEEMAQGWLRQSEEQKRMGMLTCRLKDILNGEYPSAGTEFYRGMSAIENGQSYDPKKDTEYLARPGPASKLKTEELMRLEVDLVSRAHGGKSPNCLKQIRIELFRRKLVGIEGLNVVRQICRLCRKKYRSKITHAELFRALWPCQPYDGCADGSRIRLALDAAMLFCIENGLPPMNTLVVNRLDRGLTQNDIKMIYETAKYLGVVVGSKPSEYVSEEAEVAEEIHYFCEKRGATLTLA